MMAPISGRRLLIVMACVSVSAWAETATWIDHATAPTTETQIVTNPAKHWSLEVSEYQRYTTLMEGPLGKWNPSIDPLLALGMFAESPEQERRYAELYAQQEQELTARALRFQTTYRAAFQRLFPDVRIIDRALIQPYFAHRHTKETLTDAQRILAKRFQTNDHLLVFVSAPCSACASIMKRLIELIHPVANAHIDVYVRDARDEEAVRRWANAHPINSNSLDKKRVSLNRDDGLFDRLRQRSPKPVEGELAVYLQREGRLFQLALGDLGL